MTDPVTNPIPQDTSTPVQPEITIDLDVPAAPAPENVTLDFSDITAEPAPAAAQEVIVSEPTPVVEEIPVMEITTPEPVQQDRLAQEDKIVEATQTPVQPENTPVIIQEKQDLPASDLQKDHAIIAEIESLAGQTSAPAPVAVTPVVEEVTAPVVEAPVSAPATATQAPVWIDLDSFLSTPTPTPTPTLLPAAIPAVVVPSPGFNFPTITPPVAAAVMQTPVMMPKKTETPGLKWLLYTVSFVVLGIVTWFILKTMYPLQYEQLFQGKDQIAQSSDSILSTLNQTWTIQDITGTIVVDTGIMETLTGSSDSLFSASSGIIDQGHASAPQTTSWFDAFQDLQTAMETGINTDEVKLQLQTFVDQGKKYVVIAKKTNNKDILKTSLFLWKKAEALQLSLENWDKITSDEVNKQLASFTSSLEQLHTLGNASTPSPDQSISDTQTDTTSGSLSSESSGTSVMTENLDQTQSLFNTGDGDAQTQ